MIRQTRQLSLSPESHALHVSGSRATSKGVAEAEVLKSQCWK